MNRIAVRETYSRLFYDLVMRCEPQKPHLGVEVLSRKAEERAGAQNIPIEEAYRQIYEEAKHRVEKRVALMKACGLSRTGTQTQISRSRADD